MHVASNTVSMSTYKSRDLVHKITDNLNLLRVFDRTDVGTSPNFDNPGFNGFFEVRASSETTGESGTKPVDSFYGMLSMKTSAAMLQLAGSNTQGWWIRGKQAGNVTLASVAWQRVVVADGGTYSINANSATLLKCSYANGTPASSSWNHGKTGYGDAKVADVWGQKWSVTGQTYTPSGGSATNLTNTGDIVIFVSKSNTSNNLYANLVLDGNIYATTFVGALTGNASTATKLATAREIYVALGSTRDTDNKVTFDGSADKAIHVSGTLGVGRGGTGKTSWTAGRIIYASATDTLAEVASPGNTKVLRYTNDAYSWLSYTNINTASTLVFRDSSGNFSAGTITATFNGNLTGNVTGDCSGSSGSCTGNAATCTTANGLASLVTATRANHSNDTGVIVQNTDSTNPLKIGYIIGNGGSGGIYDFTHSAWKVQIAPDGTTTFAGNASTATKLATAREIYVALGSTRNTDSKVTFDGSADKAIHVSGTLGVGRGGTGKTSWTAGRIIYASATNTLAEVAAPSNTKVLRYTGDAYSWLSYTNANTVSTLVFRDSSGNFSAGTITATFSGDLTGHVLKVCGTTSATMSSSSANPRIVFAESTNTQPVLLVYTDYDSYRSPAGLKVVGGTDATPAWFEVEGHIYASQVHNAIWNDYAECRKADCEEPGYVISPDDNGISHKTTERLMPGCRIISDTWGHIIGESTEAKTPIAVSGRVLAYPYRAKNEYHVGDCVCSAQNGTVDIMTREEIKEWPDRIIGIVNEIPTYDVWEQTEPDGERRTTRIQVKGRIWIDVR